MGQEHENLEESQTEEIANMQEDDEAGRESEVEPLDVALAEAAEYKDKYLRAHADFENAKKKT